MNPKTGETINHVDYRINDSIDGVWKVWWIRGSTYFVHAFTSEKAARIFIKHKKKTESNETYQFLKDMYEGRENTNFSPYRS